MLIGLRLLINLIKVVPKFTYLQFLQEGPIANNFLRSFYSFCKEKGTLKVLKKWN